MQRSGSRLAISAGAHAAALLLAASLRVSTPAPQAVAREHIVLIAPAKLPASKPPSVRIASVPVHMASVQAPRQVQPREFSAPQPSSPQPPAPPPAPIEADLPSAPVKLLPAEPQRSEPLTLPPPAIVVGKLASASTAPPAATLAALRPGGFSSNSPAAAPPPPRAISAAGFGSASVETPSTSKSAARPAAATAVEILYKPRPVYTEEGRRERIEGEVLLEVLFAASGEIRVERVLRGLGHGLDEAAAHSARNIQFRPATRAGEPVDQTATLHIRFQLAY